MKLLSVLVPCYNEQETVEDFYQEFIKNDAYFSSQDIEYEIVFINDGSKDNTVQEVKKLIECDKRVHLLSFSRNFAISIKPNPYALDLITAIIFLLFCFLISSKLFFNISFLISERSISFPSILHILILHNG